MEIIKSLEAIEEQKDECCLALGTFDGVHLGHRSVLDTMLAKAKKSKLASAVFTFQGHPRGQIINRQPPPLLSTLDEKIVLLEKLGVEKLFTFEFTKDFADMSPEEFFLFLLRLKVKAIVIGFNYTFARERCGTVELLEELGQKYGVSVDVVIPFHLQKSIVSSTLIRQLIHDGEIEEANLLLDYPYAMQGRVVHGFKNGRKIGFPTANLDFPKEKAVPANGVYAVELVLHDQCYQGVCNVGYRPTFRGRSLSIETHILDFAADIYNEFITVRFLTRIRPEQHFIGITELVAQIKKDEQFARDYFLRQKRYQRFLEKYSDLI